MTENGQTVQTGQRRRQNVKGDKHEGFTFTVGRKYPGYVTQYEIIDEQGRASFAYEAAIEQFSEVVDQ